MAPGDAGDALGLGQAVIVAGIGCRKGASAAEIDAALDTALERAGRPLARIDLMATSAKKGDEAGIAAVAAARGLRLTLVAQPDLETASARGATWSARVLALAGVPSVAEAAALAACGPKARLILPRIVVGPVTCALAEGGDAP
jgi:cobalt-precorrin 5A hydrolase